MILKICFQSLHIDIGAIPHLAVADLIQQHAVGILVVQIPITGFTICQSCSHTFSGDSHKTRVDSRHIEQHCRIHTITVGSDSRHDFRRGNPNTIHYKRGIFQSGYFLTGTVVETFAFFQHTTHLFRSLVIDTRIALRRITVNSATSHQFRTSVTHDALFEILPHGIERKHLP